MTLVNVISALGNNNSIYPLLVRDCGIENVAKVAMTYNQNVKDSKFIAKQATRERIIDEYGTSAVWLGGIPALSWVSDKAIKKSGLCPNFNIKLFKESAAQGINANIEKFKNIAPEEVKSLINIKNNKKAFQMAQVNKFLATTLIPIGLMGYVLPKMNFRYTAKKIEQAKQDKNFTPNFGQAKIETNILKLMEQVKKEKKNNSNNISFKGIESLANLSTLQKMMILDGGLTVGRVATARNKDEKAEMAFKMAGMCYLNYVAPKSIDKFLNKVTKKTFGINTELDPKFLNDKQFLADVKSSNLNLPKGTSEKELINFVDTNSNSIFTKLAQKANIVTFLKSGVRDPREYVETEKLKELKSAIEEFSKDAIKSGNVEKFAKKALYAKSFNILANVGISSALLAVALPKMQFIFRKALTGSDLEPGIKV